ncbi:MAG: V-type ATPase subunit [Candidatus Thermoplasmatota archaeon]|nr:V-type ATPase subunit [Candidatus Thermoplasmatota archaeon]
MFETLFDPNSYPFWVLIISILAGAVIVISHPFSTYIKFVYPNAKFEAMGNPFISSKELESIIDGKGLISFKETINTLKDYNISGEDTYSVQKSLDDAFIKTVEMMKNDSSKKMYNFYDVYLERFDMHLIKNVLKRKLEDKEIKKIDFDQAVLPTTNELLNKISDCEKEGLPSVLRDFGFEGFVIDSISDETVDYLKIDTAIDRHFIDKLNKVRVPYKCEDGKQKFVGTMMDIINIKNVLRAKQFGYDSESCKKLFIGEGQEIAPWKYDEISDVNSVPQVISSIEGTSYFDALKNSIEEYTKEESVQVLETSLDCLLLKLVSDISAQNYVTIGPTIRFLVSKEFEIRNLKIIAKGISESLSPDSIKSFLVMGAN